MCFFKTQSNLKTDLRTAKIIRRHRQMDNRATAWSVTINNPTSTDEEQMSLARQKGWKVEGQLEQGTEGTPHYQLLVKTPQVRFSAVKKAFPRGHVEKARNVVALSQYVTKSDTRLSELPTTQEQYPSMSKLWDLITAYLNDQPAYSMHIYHGSIRILGLLSEERTELIMDMFDSAITYLIRLGYHVESMAVNPQVRACWKRYYKPIFERSLKKSLNNLETASQTDTALVSVVSIPVIEHNNADYQEDNETQASSSSSSPSPSQHD